MLNYIFIVILLAFSAFFSGSEIAYSSANIIRLRHIAENGGGKRDKAALDIAQDYDSALTTILIGNNLVNIASSSVATVIALDLLGESGAWVATLVMTVLIITFGEITPKIIAAEACYSVVPLVALPLRFLMIVLSPVGKVIMFIVKQVERLWADKVQEVPTVTEDEFETIIETVEDEGILDEDRCDLLQSALDFDDVLAYEIITPRVDMTAIDIDDPMDEIMEQIMYSPFSRIPVYEDTIDNIIGILHLNRVFKRLADKDDIDLRDMLMPVTFVHKTTPLNNVLSTMKRKKCHMVIVTDEYGGTMGCLTMEDVLEQLVGDIWDESDEIEEELIQLKDDLYDADGDMRIEDLFAELDIDDRDFDDDNATLGGWTTEMIGGYPKKGDSFTYKNLTITVKKRKNLRVERLLVKVDPIVEEEEE